MTSRWIRIAKGNDFVLNGLRIEPGGTCSLNYLSKCSLDSWRYLYSHSLGAGARKGKYTLRHCTDGFEFIYTCLTDLEKEVIQV